MSDVSGRIASLSARARRDREAFEPPEDPPDEERALSYLTEGVGPAIGVYVDARTGERARIEPAEFEDLEGAFNDWLELYAACYGVDLQSTYNLREAAELLVDTHSVRDTALLLTQVPERDTSEAWSHGR